MLFGSPMEDAFFVALCRLRKPYFHGVMPSSLWLPGATVDVPLVELGGADLGVWPQLPVRSKRVYRLDFALVGLRGSRWVYVDVEVDGHDFHERTKEQAEHDRRRDRDLQVLGWRIARFTGSQVHRDAAAAAGAALEFLSSLLSNREGR